MNLEQIDQWEADVFVGRAFSLISGLTLSVKQQEIYPLYKHFC